MNERRAGQGETQREGLERRVDGVVGAALMVLFFVLTCTVSWQVFSRYALGAPATVTEEVARFCFLWLAFLGGAYVVGQRKHLAVDLLASRPTFRNSRVLPRLVTAMGVLFVTSVLLVGGVYLVQLSFELGQKSPVLGLPLGYVYSVVPLAGLLADFYLLTAPEKKPAETGTTQGQPEGIS